MKYEDCKKCPKELCNPNSPIIVYTDKDIRYNLYGPCRYVDERFVLYTRTNTQYFNTINSAIDYLMLLPTSLEHTIDLTKIKSQITVAT